MFSTPDFFFSSKSWALDDLSVFAAQRRIKTLNFIFSFPSCPTSFCKLKERVWMPVLMNINYVIISEGRNNSRQFYFKWYFLPLPLSQQYYLSFSENINYDHSWYEELKVVFHICKNLLHVQFIYTKHSYK